MFSLLFAFNLVIYSLDFSIFSLPLFLKSRLMPLGNAPTQQRCGIILNMEGVILAEKLMDSFRMVKKFNQRVIIFIMSQRSAKSRAR
jgi:hypothetical protein